MMQVSNLRIVQKENVLSIAVLMVSVSKASVNVMKDLLVLLAIERNV